ncbi:hypothetical protein BV20DRAFT_1029844 [Pilatotrama ljubarskyi]|nr:hypothetical protein BV20DRAFT_1029844 [Pilatotrama ljubarskyi]
MAPRDRVHDRTATDTLPSDGANESPIPHNVLHDPELRRRGIVLRMVFKPDVVFGTADLDSRNYVVKVLDLDTQELPIYERLLANLGPANHTVPSELVHSRQSFLIMPILSDIYAYMRLAHTSLRFRLLRAFYELVEGIEFLHNSHVAHMDIHSGNIMVANPNDAAYHESLVAHRIYIIDFDTARQFALGPGHQHAITLPETYYEPPNGLTEFDPYSWDVYCLGRTFQYFLEYGYSSRGRRPPWIARWYANWLVGDESGCAGSSRSRPTAKTARRVLVLIQWALPVIEVAQKLVDLFSS